MVILSDIKHEFDASISGQKALVFVYPNVDGLCSWRILKSLFAHRQVMYTVLVTPTKLDIQKAYVTNKEIVSNFYNQRQVRLICLNEDTSDIPAFEDVFRDFSSDEEGSDDNDQENNPNTRRNLEDRMTKRRWQRRRHDLLTTYESFSFHTIASSIVLFDLAWKLSQDNPSLLCIPRRECEQRFSTMSGSLQGNIRSLFRAHCENFGLSTQDIFLPSFTIQLGYRTPISAIDAVFITLTELENLESGDLAANFQSALDITACWNYPNLDRYISRSQLHLQHIADQVRNLIDSDEVVAFGPFLYAYIRKESLVHPCLGNHLSLAMLAKYTLKVKQELRPRIGRSRLTAQMPLIMCVDSINRDGYLTLLGIPPLQGDDDRNLFCQAFEAASQRTNAKVEFKFFNPNCIELHREDLLKFFEAVSNLLS